MTQTAQSWKRIVVEGTAIVVSILLAFAIDAWWENRKQHDDDMAHLKGVLGELELHTALLQEAIESHRGTVDLGYELLALLESEQTAATRERTVELLDLLLNFYRINAPFGSLQTAISSGAIARMNNVELASAIASWPTTIDDLLEEESNSAELLVLGLYELLGEKVSMHEVYAHRLAFPTGRGTNTVIEDVARPMAPISRPSPDYTALQHDQQVINQLMQLMVWGQAALAEATQASDKLEGLKGRLAEYIGPYDRTSPAEENSDG